MGVTGKVSVLAFVLSLFVFVPRIVASEGRFTMGTGSVGCEGISIWQDGQYRINGRCQGLVYPYGDGMTVYTLWANPLQENGKPRRVDDIDQGIIDGRLQEPFSGLVITAERSGSPRDPSGTQIMSGSLSGFSFQGSQTGFGQALGATVAPQPVITVTPTPTPVRAGISLPGVFSAIPISLIVIVVIIFAVILFIVRRVGG